MDFLHQWYLHCPLSELAMVIEYWCSITTIIAGISMPRGVDMTYPRNHQICSIAVISYPLFKKILVMIPRLPILAMGKI